MFGKTQLQHIVKTRINFDFRLYWYNKLNCVIKFKTFRKIGGTVQCIFLNIASIWIPQLHTQKEVSTSENYCSFSFLVSEYQARLSLSRSRWEIPVVIFCVINILRPIARIHRRIVTCLLSSLKLDVWCTKPKIIHALFI